MACQHPNSVGDIRSGGHHEVHELANGRLEGVIVMTFWYVFWNGLNFFELFKLYFHSGLITTPHVLYVHMTYVYSFFLCFILHTITWPREVIIVL